MRKMNHWNLSRRSGVRPFDLRYRSKEQSKVNRWSTIRYRQMRINTKISAKAFPRSCVGKLPRHLAPIAAALDYRRFEDLAYRPAIGWGGNGFSRWARSVGRCGIRIFKTNNCHVSQQRSECSQIKVNFHLLRSLAGRPRGRIIQSRKFKWYPLITRTCSIRQINTDARTG